MWVLIEIELQRQKKREFGYKPYGIAKFKL